MDGILNAHATFVTEPEVVTHTVEEITGAPAGTFKEWAIDHTGEDSQSPRGARTPLDVTLNGEMIHDLAYTYNSQFTVSSESLQGPDGPEHIELTYQLIETRD